MREAETQSEYQAKLKVSFAVLGICHQGERLTRIDYLPRRTRALSPQTPFAAKVCRQLKAYLRDPDARFDLPVRMSGTPYQQRVWRAIQQIPRGHTLTYGEIARKLFSGPRAVGQACGANPVPLIVPCHRVLGSGKLGGFMNCDKGDPLAIKRWLLKHERG
ncbi:MAG: methylated-DNA--[protein]-cysteine S-methyltransferase [Burkholderiales bacterium]